ncbi:response regulator transcription factor [Angustibacter sp. McL0619]|uniref:response regulator transcription factor n=1 Tax=Angustibacter sp. McL0619 TaxID=3415676 RepID=UPI003CE6760F
MGSLNRTTSAVLDVATAALQGPPSTDVVGPVLQALRSTIGADVAGYYRHEWFGWTTALRIVPDEMWQHIPHGHLPTAEAGAMHAGIQFLVTHRGPCEPFAITDLVPEREWLALEMCRQMRPNWGRNYQLAIPVTPEPGVPETRVWVLGRGEHDFTMADRAAAEALRRLLDVISRQAQCREQHRLSYRATGQQLTERELTVLQLLEDGITATGTAMRLGISVRTVQKHTERIYRKLGAHNLHTALQAAAELSLIVGPTLGSG